MCRPAALWRAVGGHEPGFTNHGLGAGAAQARRLETGPGLFRAFTANRAEIQAVALGKRLRHAGFDLRGEAGKYGEGCGNKRSSSNRLKCFDLDGPLSFLIFSDLCGPLLG